MLSTGASSSSVLLTHIPPGTATKEFNITMVAYVSDILGSTAVTSIGVDGVPVAIVSTPPEQVRCGTSCSRHTVIAFRQPDPVAATESFTHEKKHRLGYCNYAGTLIPQIKC